MSDGEADESARSELKAIDQPQGAQGHHWSQSVPSQQFQGRDMEEEVRDHPFG
jgi:hypothetical protein